MAGKANLLETKISELELNISELTEKWKRALADYQNLEKRFEREKADFVRYSNSSLILKFLAVFCHLEKASELSTDQGLKLIVSEFKKIFSEEGVSEIKCEGLVFNPEMMEAVDAVEGKEEDEGKIAEVVNKGYLLKEKLLLPAMVKVYTNSKEEGRPA